jgi:hypothetical protein
VSVYHQGLDVKTTSGEWRKIPLFDLNDHRWLDLDRPR